jgi:hypothetical protein
VEPTLSTVATIPTVLPNGDRAFQVNLKGKDGQPIPFSGVPIVAHIFAKRHPGKGANLVLNAFVSSYSLNLLDEPVPVTIVDLGNGVFDVVLKPTAGAGDYNVDIGLPKADQPNAIGVHIGDAPFDVKIDLDSGIA